MNKIQKNKRYIDPSQPKKRTSQDYIDSIFNNQAPRPTYDKENEKELKRRIKWNAIGQGLKTVGDAFSLSQVGNVVKRAKDERGDRLAAQIRANKEKYKNAMYNAEYKDWQNKVKKGYMELNQKNIEDAAKAKYLQEQKGFAQKGTQIEQAGQRVENAKTAADRNYELNKQKYEATNAQNAADAKIAADALLAKRIEDDRKAGEKNLSLYTKGGQRVHLRKNEETKILAMIMEENKDNITDDQLALLKPILGGTPPTSAQLLLINEFLYVSETTKAYIKANYGIDVMDETPSTQQMQTPQTVNPVSQNPTPELQAKKDSIQKQQQVLQNILP